MSDEREHSAHSFGNIAIRRDDPPPVTVAPPPAAESAMSEGPAVAQVQDDAVLATEVVRSPAPRRRAGSRPMLALLLVLVLAGLYSVAGFLILPGMLRTFLVGWSSEQLGMTVDIDLVRCNPYTGSITIAGFQALPPGSGKTPALAWREAEAVLAPSSLWHRALLVSRVRVEAPVVHLVRQDDRHYNLERLLTLLSSAGGGGRLALPPLALHDISLRGGRLVFEDLPRGKTHVADDVELTLPRLGAAFSHLPSNLQPAFSASVNGSPMRFSGGESAAAAAQEGTRLSFQLQQVDLVQYQKYWPWPVPGMELRGGRADGTLALVFRQGQERSQLTLDGTLDLAEVQLEKEGGMLLRLPRGRLAFSAAPWRRQYVLHELVLQEPEGTLRLSGGQDEGLGRAAALLGAGGQAVSPAVTAEPETGLRLERLEVAQGRLVLHSSSGAGARRDELRDLRLLLQGFANRAVPTEERPREEGLVELEALSSGGASETVISLQGRIDPAAGLDARLGLRNLDLAWYQALMPGLAQLRSLAGRGHLQGRLLGGSPAGSGLRLAEGALTLTDYAWQDDGWGAVRGKALHCRGLALDMSARKGSCERLELEAADMRPGPAARLALFGLAAGGGKPADTGWRWQVDSLDIRGSRWHLALPQLPPPPGRRAAAVELPLAELNLQVAAAAGAAAGNQEFSLSARLGERGQVQARGAWQREGKNNSLQLEAKELELAVLKPLLTPWLRPEVTGGRLALRGTLSFPGSRFSGSAWVDELRAGRDNEPRLSLLRGEMTGLSVTPAPWHLALETFTARKAEVVEPLSSSGQTVPGGLQAFFHFPAAAAAAPLEVGRIVVEQGSVRLPVPALQAGQSMDLFDLQGHIDDFSLRRGSRYRYEFRARPAQALRAEPEAALVMHGEGSPGAGVVRGQVQARRLVPVLLSELSELGGQRAWMDLTRQWPEGPDGATVNHLACRGVRPRTSSSPLASALALLTDPEGVLRLRIVEEGTEEGEAPSLTALVTRLLRRYSVKAELSPALVLAESVPELAAAGDMAFAPGESTLSEAGRRILVLQAELMRRRPAVLLRLRPGFDPQADRRVLQERLQREADARRAEENQRRERLRQERSAAELQRLAAEAAKSGKAKAVTVEALPPDPPELAPLPPETVEVAPELLRRLALDRAGAARDYLLSQEGLPAHRLQVEQPDEGGALVRFAVGADFVRASFRDPLAP